MGEARWRKIAREAGRPFVEDALPAPKPKPWYMEAPPPQEVELLGSPARLELLHRREVQLPLALPPPGPPTTEATSLARTIRTPDNQLVLVVDEKVILQGTRKRPLTGRELAVIMALISTGGR